LKKTKDQKLEKIKKTREIIKNLIVKQKELSDKFEALLKEVEDPDRKKTIESLLKLPPELKTKIAEELNEKKDGKRSKRFSRKSKKKKSRLRRRRT